MNSTIHTEKFPQNDVTFVNFNCRNSQRKRMTSKTYLAIPYNRKKHQIRRVVAVVLRTPAVKAAPNQTRCPRSRMRRAKRAKSLAADQIRQQPPIQRPAHQVAVQKASMRASQRANMPSQKGRANRKESHLENLPTRAAKVPSIHPRKCQVVHQNPTAMRSPHIANPVQKIRRAVVVAAVVVVVTNETRTGKERSIAKRRNG